MEKSKLSVTQQLAYTDAVAYLEALVESFKSGNIVVEQAGEFVTLSPREHVEVTIEAKAKKDKQKFSLELSWAYPPAVETAAVTISSTSPVITEGPCDDTPLVEAPDNGAKNCPCSTSDTTPQPGEESASSEVSAASEIPASQEPRADNIVQDSILSENSGVPDTIEDVAEPFIITDIPAADAAVQLTGAPSVAQHAAKRPPARKKTGNKKTAGNKANTKR